MLLLVQLHTQLGESSLINWFSSTPTNDNKKSQKKLKFCLFYYYTADRLYIDIN